MFKLNLLSKKRKSFTLAELVISIGILGLVLTLTAGVLVSVVRSYARQRVIAEVERNGDFVARVLYEKLRVAQGVSCSDENGDPIGTPPTCQNLIATNPSRITTRFLRIINFDGSVEYVGVGEPTATNTCDLKNNFIFITTTPENITPASAITNSLPAGVQIESFGTEVITGANGTKSVTVKVGVKQSACETLFAATPESKSFDIFVTVRSTYK